MKYRVFVIVVLLIVPAFAQSVSAPAESALQRLQFLYGDWKASGDTQLGAGQGEFSFQPDLNSHIVVRHNFAEYKSGPAAGTRHDDLMVVYVQQPGAAVHASYFDSEGHVIQYTVTFPAENQVVFASDASQAGPKYRLSYVLEGKTLNGKFEIAMPGKEFKTYLDWKSQKAESAKQ